MKIVIATPLYPPESGGPATYSKLLEDGLPKHGIEVALVKFSDVKHLPKLLRHAGYFFRVLKAARTADIVYALDAVSVGFPAMLAAKFARKPFAVKIVGDYAWEQGRQRFGITQDLDEFVRTKKVPAVLQRLRNIQTRVVRRAKFIVVPSNYLKAIVQEWGIELERITVVHNAIRAEAAGTLPPGVKALRQNNKKLVVSIGRLVPWKGFSELIEAIAKLRSEGIDTSLVIVGDGPQRAELEGKAKRLLMKDFVFTGSLPHGQAHDVMLAADVFVLDSLYEGMSHTLIEALVTGVPVIVSEVGGNKEIVRDGENGLLVLPEDPAVLADALMRVLTDDALHARLAAASKKTGEDFSPETMLERTAGLLKKI